MEINKKIFKSYDIRGIYPEELNEEAAKLIAQTYLKILLQNLNKPIRDLNIAVGRDNRKSSGPLSKTVIDTFLDWGATVDDLGLISVNDIYFAVGYYKYDGGIIATASHNPQEYGGFKMVSLDLSTTSIDFINGKFLYEKLLSSDFSLNENKLQGKLQKKDIIKDHLSHILSFIDLNKIKPFKVVVDTGNGMNAPLITELFKELPCQLIPLFFELDGSFPNRPPNPLVEGAQQKVGQKVLEEKADFGVMYDVDGDRMFLIDEQGEFIRGDMILSLLAKAMLDKNPGAGIVYNLICSHAVPDLVKKWGGRPIRSEVGYRHLAEHMRNEDGIMSGEVSGHFAFKKNFYADSGFIALVLALETISEDGRKLSEIIKEYNLYSRGDEINIEVEDIPEKLEKIRNYYKDNIKDEIDGITVEFDDWWFNIRPSNTEPLLRITVEASNEDELKKRQKEVLNVINI
jgi:phosphomannomutase